MRYFEAVSGLTTTGATVLTKLDELPVSINVWRTFLQWLGGMGILVLAVAILPLLGVGGSQLFKAEVAGPIKDSKLTPRVKETAKGLWGIYASFSMACVLAYWAGGMTPIDALMHMFTTVSLGGLSSHDASFALLRVAAARRRWPWSSCWRPAATSRCTSSPCARATGAASGATRSCAPRWWR